ncbi:uncharacterized protein G2W53_015525 [Senna tora]|uniref:Uncharacterized protein n=1 Tax=Senna tora TaxID=362788 RepID=A0A835CA35_9FABA|nr:uncharacterized protein G2W53_015525 [Senna tora]
MANLTFQAYIWGAFEPSQISLLFAH